jgi:hypothetical protein
MGWHQQNFLESGALPPERQGCQVRNPMFPIRTTNQTSSTACRHSERTQRESPLTQAQRCSRIRLRIARLFIFLGKCCDNSWLRQFRILHATKTEVICACADLTLPSCPDNVPGTILVCTQVRASSMYLLLFVWLFGVGPQRISSYASDCSELLVIIGAIPVARPLPDVASHVVEAIIRG